MSRALKFATLALLPLMPATAQYSARVTPMDGVRVVQLEDRRHHTSVSVAPSIGNIAFAMTVNGSNVLWFPYESVGQFHEKPRMCGIPLLAPWADRLDEPAFYANGKRYAFNLGLGTVRIDKEGHPIHGFLTMASEWHTTSVEADATSARATSSLDVSRRPEWMAQFPFAHTIEITHVLRDGVLEVITAIDNRSVEPMPVSIGYHPFFHIGDAPRDDWTVGLAAEKEWPVNQDLLPAGNTRPLAELIANPSGFSLKGREFDNGFSDLIRDAAGRATFWVQGKQQKIEVVYGPKFLAGEIWAPPASEFICLEPMTAINNGLNLAHRGVYKELQSVPAGGRWQESFWIRPSGF